VLGDGRAAGPGFGIEVCGDGGVAFEDGRDFFGERFEEGERGFFAFAQGDIDGFAFEFVGDEAGFGGRPDLDAGESEEL